MPIMEDSGIDSEDRQSMIFDDAQTVSESIAAADVDAELRHMADLEVAFRGAGDKNPFPIYKQTSTDLKISHNGGSEDNGGNSSGCAGGDVANSAAVRTQPPNTCRILQRKLEMKVERAKRNYTKYQEEQAKKSQSANLIPLNRLPIPGEVEQKPLVDYKSDSSDEPEEISFFPAKLKNARHQRKTELSDTFSIQEMTIDSELDTDDSGSQNLELLPPRMKLNMLDKLKSCFGCASYAS